MKLKVDFRIHEVPGVADEVCLDPAVGSLKGRACAEVDGGRPWFFFRKDGSTGIDTIGRQAFVLGSEVGGGKSDAVAAAVTGHDPAQDGEGAAEHGGGLVEVSGLDRLADPAAADALPCVQDRVGIVENDFAGGAPSGQKIHIAAPIPAKTPVGPDGDGLQGWKGGAELREKGVRLLPRAGGVEGKGDGEADAPALQHTDFVGKSGDQGRMFFRV